MQVIKVLGSHTQQIYTPGRNRLRCRLAAMSTSFLARTRACDICNQSALASNNLPQHLYFYNAKMPFCPWLAALQFFSSLKTSSMTWLILSSTSTISGELKCMVHFQQIFKRTGGEKPVGKYAGIKLSGL